MYNSILSMHPRFVLGYMKNTYLQEQILKAVACTTGPLEAEVPRPYVSDILVLKVAHALTKTIPFSLSERRQYVDLFA